MRLTYNRRLYGQRMAVAFRFVWLTCSVLPRLLLAQGFTISPIARPGDPAPDGEVFVTAYNVSINDNGQIAFPALISRIITGLFLFDQGEIFKIAEHGTPTRCGTFGLFDYPSLNPKGQIAFSAQAGLGGIGVFLWDGNKSQAIACPGDPAPDCGTFGSVVSNPTLNYGGQMAFAGRLSTSDFGIFFYDSKKITKITCPGDPAPGGGNFIRAFVPTINDQGQVAFEAEISPQGSGIFLYDKGQVRAIARQGDCTPEGGTFGYLTRPRINNLRQVAFVEFRGAMNVLWLDGGKGIRRILPAIDPETGDEIALLNPRGGPPHPFYLNDLGQIVFEGRRTGQNGVRQGLLFFDGERFANIVFSGDPMPDPHGYLFDDFLRLALNNVGQAAFIAGYPRLSEAGLFIAVPTSQ